MTPKRRVTDCKVVYYPAALADQGGEHSAGGYCGRQSQTDTWTDMDHHSTFSGEAVRHVVMLRSDRKRACGGLLINIDGGQILWQVTRGFYGFDRSYV